MIKWYDRIGNSIEMKIYKREFKPFEKPLEDEPFEWIRGKVVEGYRYQDGIVTMKPDNGGDNIWCGCSSGNFRKTKDSLGDFISNADKIRSMTDEELADLFHNTVTYKRNEADLEQEIDIFFDDKSHEVADNFGSLLEWLQSEAESEVKENE